MVKNLFKGCLTVPNLLSLIRIFLIPAFAVLYYKGHIGCCGKSEKVPV